MHEHCEEIVQSLKRDNATLLEALEALTKAPVYHSSVDHPVFEQARAAIAQAKEQK